MTDRTLDIPLAVRRQPLPRAGGNTFSIDNPPMLVDGDRLTAADLSVAEIGAYVWMAQRQAHMLPNSTRLLSEWMRDQRFRRSGEWVHSDGEASQIVHQLEVVGAVAWETGQPERLAEVRRERAEVEALFAEPDPPRQTRAPKPVGEQPKPSETKRHVPDEDGHWRGAWPIPTDGTYPAKGQNVVYLLRAANDLVVYVGSTNHFHARMKAHQGGGKRWVAWEAIPCDTRDEAYDVESEYMQLHMPHLNVAGPRGGES